MENTVTKEPTKKTTARYIEAVGRRKTAVARVRFYSADNKGKLADKSGIKVNGRTLGEYFPSPRYASTLVAPLKTLKVEDGLVEIKIVGGGINAQAEAAALGIARSLVEFNEAYKKILRAGGYLTRDPRMVERKKYGKTKARRGHQWRKR